MRAINRDSTVSWWFQWAEFSGGDARQIYRLKTMANGDIVGVGQFTCFSSDFWATAAPFIFRLSSEGELLWKRVFVESASSYPEWTVYGFLYDVYEFENGYLMAVGGWRGQPEDNRSDPIVILMDSEGCILSGCEELIPTATGEANQVFKSRISIFPNPVAGGVLNIGIQPANEAFAELGLKIYDFQGRLLQWLTIHTGQNSIDLSHCNSGMYFLQIEENGVFIDSEKVVIK